MTPKEMFDKLSGEMTRANNEITDILNRYGNNMYHLGCIAGEETLKTNTPKSQLAKIMHALYLDYPDSSAYTAVVSIVTSDNKILYIGPANNIPPDIVNADWTIISIIPDPDDKSALPLHNKPKLITVI